MTELSDEEIAHRLTTVLHARCAEWSVLGEREHAAEGCRHRPMAERLVPAVRGLIADVTS